MMLWIFVGWTAWAEPVAPCLADVVPGMACVPGGEFIRGTAAAHDCEQGENRDSGLGFGPPAPIWLQTYYMDLTEVTVEDYRACRAAGHCEAARPFYSDFSRPRQPMMGANWHEAKRYCEAMGKHLPTEAEWEKAARGPNGEQGPFGDQAVACDQAVIRDARGRSCGVRKKGRHAKVGRVWTVAEKPAGRYGLYDMVGNAEEWVADWYSDLSTCGADCLGPNPKGPCQGAAACPGHDKKMVKGGSWYWPASHATGWHRRPHTADNQPFHHFGFRCAASLEEANALSRSAP